MATFPSNHPVQEEEEVQTEEADLAKPTEEEVRTEEEDEHREEATESFLDFDSLNSRLYHILEDEGPGKGAESQKPQEDSITNLFHVPPNRSATQMSQVMMPPAEQIPRSDYQSVNHDSTTFSSDQNGFDVSSLVSQSPFQQQQRLTSVQNRSLVTLFPRMITTKQPGWFISDHSSASAWRPLIIRPDHQHPMVNQLANIDGLLNQTFVPRPLFSPVQTHFIQQPHLNEIALSMYRYYPYMRPEANHLNLRMPHFRSDLMFTMTSPSGQLRSFVLLHDQFNPHHRFVLSLDDALVFGPLVEMDDHPQTQQRQLFDFPIDMIHRQASPNALVAPRPQLNQQQTQQLQHQRFNEGPSSHQGQDQQQPKPKQERNGS